MAHPRRLPTSCGTFPPAGGGARGLAKPVPRPLLVN
jgi:hypothetical protein